VTVSDGDGPAVTQTYTVNVTGADDAPTLAAVVSGSVAEVDQSSATTDSGLSGTLNGHDVDAGDVLAYGIQGGIDNGDGTVSLAGSYGTLTVDTTTGAYSYAKDAAAIEALDDGAHPSDAFTVTVSDGDGPAVTQTYTVNVTGADDAPVAANDTSASVGAIAATEKSGTLNGSGGNNGSGNVLTNDSDVDSASLTVSAIRTGGVEGSGTGGSLGVGLVGAHGTLTIAANGSYTYVVNENDLTVQALNTGGSTTDTFNYTVSDDSLTDTAVLTVTINGANDAPVGANDTSASLGAVAATEKSGTLNGSGGNNGSGNVLTNDTDVDSASLTVNAIRTGGVEGSGTGGSLGVGLVGAHGTLTIAANGSYTYVVNENDLTVQALNTGGSTTDTFNYTVSDGSLTDTAVLTVTINGANDAPVGVNDTSASLGAIAATEKGGTLNASGGNNGSGNVLTNDSDVDSASLTVSAIRTGGVEGSGTGGSLGVGLVGAHGTLTIAANGSYTYVVNENDSTVQALNAGGTTTDTFNYTVSDGSLTDTAVLTVTINGANDAAVLSSASVNLTEGNTAADISTSGTLTISDVDSPATFVAQAANVGTYGTFAINAAGAWTYTASSAHDEFVAGQHYIENFDAVSADGTHTSVHIDILGTNDNGAPVAVADTNWAKEDTNTSATGNVLQTLVHAGAPSGTFSDHADTDPDADTLAVSALSGGIDNGTTFTKTGTYGSLVITKATGAYTYTLANAQGNVQALAAGQTVTDSFTYTVSDGHGGTSSTNLAVTVFGTDEPSNTLISTVVQGNQGNNNDPSTATITFSRAVHANFASISDAIHITSGGALVPGTGSFNATLDQYTFSVVKTGNNGSTYNLTIDAGAFSDNIGNTNAIKVINGSLKPAGTSGEPINLALTDPSHEGALITVTVKDVPSGWTIDGATHNADGSWTTQTNDLHGLTVTTPVEFTGAAVLDVQLTWTNADGTTGSASIADNVEAYAPGSPIFAWSGDDVLTGSSGNDLFVFSQPIGADTVHNFDTAADQIDLIGYNGLADFADLQTHIADDAHGNAVITLGDGQSITLDGVHSGALTAGNFVFDQTPVVNNSGTMTIGDGALLPLSGTINNSGLISLDSTGSETLLQIIQHGVTLQGGGQILLSDSAANVISGTGPDVTLVNIDNTISGAGQLGGGMLGLDNQGTIIASGANALVIDTGGSVVTNSGTLEATGSGGLTITGGLANSGMLLANGGDIVIHGQVTGDGDATIGDLSKLEFGGASSTDVTFAHDAAGTLQLDDSFDFSGRIGGITNDDRLELEDILFGAGTTAVYQANQDGSGGTLTVSDGTHGTALHLVGSYDANGFKLADDGQGHTAVSYNPAEFTLTGVGDGGISSDFVV
ncbi:beta strand repeat-containing protein, partial [Mesorhizobium sp. CO1-1-8]|uniref:beta strand repeat-containing protein n=1 Tax=Mesorhizobium sp. CO1-1-8 TaxID=2876631 RepID=UPI001CD04AFC